MVAASGPAAPAARGHVILPHPSTAFCCSAAVWTARHTAPVRSPSHDRLASAAATPGMLTRHLHGDTWSPAAVGLFRQEVLDSGTLSHQTQLNLI